MLRINPQQASAAPSNSLIPERHLLALLRRLYSSLTHRSPQDVRLSAGIYGGDGILFLANNVPSFVVEGQWLFMNCKTWVGSSFLRTSARCSCEPPPLPKSQAWNPKPCFTPQPLRHADTRPATALHRGSWICFLGSEAESACGPSRKLACRKTYKCHLRSAKGLRLRHTNTNKRGRVGCPILF